MGSSSDSGDCGVWGRQAGRQAVSQSEKKRFSPATERRGFFFKKNLCEVTVERCASGKKRKKKRKRHKICLPRRSGEGREKGRDGWWGGGRRSSVGAGRCARIRLQLSRLQRKSNRPVVVRFIISSVNSAAARAGDTAI